MTGRGKFADHQRGEDFAGVRMTVLGDGIGVIKKLCLHFLLFVLNSFSQFRDELWCLTNILMVKIHFGGVHDISLLQVE